ncbi:penicillin-binding protein 2, partial [Candidatus Margulisiibacteriota bacterium]
DNCPMGISICYNVSVINQKRLYFFTGLIIFLLGLLLARLVYLQIIKYEHYSLKSARIRARVIPNLAPRGHIYDRNKLVLASSKPVFSAYILPVKLENADLASKVIANILHKDEKDIYQKILRQKNKSFEPLLIKDYISFDTISLIEEQSYKLPGFVVGARNIRAYNYDSLAAHVLGYIGEIDPKRLRRKSIEGYRSGDLIGLSGIENKYEPYLRGTNGGQQVEVDPYGRPIKVLGNIEPIPGHNVALTIDLELQKVAEKALGTQKGAVVVIQPQTGDILVLVSHPAFDPNLFTAPVSPEKWAELHRAENPLHNRALTAYPSGSTFKIITAITALEYNLAKPGDKYYCPGYFMLGKRKSDCWTVHRRINFFNGLVHSCDVVFYNLGLAAGPDRIHKMGTSFGLGQLTGIDLPGESAGLLPSGRWKQKTYNEPWYPGDSINYGIGQGFFQATPLQMAYLMSIIANKGTGYQPHILKEVTNPEQELIYYFKPRITRKVTLKESTWKFIDESLYQVVERGTGVATKIMDINIAGKTGTAEDPPREMPHAWFVSYAPVKDPQLVISVFVEGGGHGGAVAAPIARKIYQHYFEKANRVE